MDKAIIGALLMILAGTVYQGSAAIADINAIVKSQQAHTQKTIAAEDCKEIVTSMEGVEFCADGQEYAPINPEMYLPLIAKQ